MKAVELERRPSGTLVVDLCDGCQVLWFDPMESPQLSPAATLELFREINEALPEVRRPLAQSMNCPRCDSLLALTQDLQHTTHFSYYRCTRGHGRLTPFFQFLREKNFIRPIPPEELERSQVAGQDRAVFQLRRADRPHQVHRLRILPRANLDPRPGSREPRRARARQHPYGGCRAAADRRGARGGRRAGRHSVRPRAGARAVAAPGGASPSTWSPSDCRHWRASCPRPPLNRSLATAWTGD